MTGSIWPESEQTQELLSGARDGDSAAIDRLMDRHRQSLHRLVAMRMDKQIARRIDVSDIVQDVLVEANRRLQDYLANPVMSFHLWLRQIAKDRMIDAHRRHRVSAKRSVDREQPLAPSPALEQSTLDLAAQLADGELTPAAAATQREMVVHVQAAIEKLDANDREVIMMRHFELLSNQEVAEALDLSEPAASMRYLRAIKKLRAALDEPK